MSRPVDPNEPTGPIEPIRPDPIEHVHVEHTAVDGPPAAERCNRGMLIGLGAGGAALLFVILIALFAGPGRPGIRRTSTCAQPRRIRASRST